MKIARRRVRRGNWTSWTGSRAYLSIQPARYASSVNRKSASMCRWSSESLRLVPAAITYHFHTSLRSAVRAVYECAKRPQGALRRRPACEGAAAVVGKSGTTCVDGRVKVPVAVSGRRGRRFAHPSGARRWPWTDRGWVFRLPACIPSDPVLHRRPDVRPGWFPSCLKPANAVLSGLGTTVFEVMSQPGAAADSDLISARVPGTTGGRRTFCMAAADAS